MHQFEVRTELIWNSVLPSKNMCSAIDKPPVNGITSTSVPTIHLGII